MVAVVVIWLLTIKENLVKTLSVVEYLTKSFTPVVERGLEKYIQDMVNKSDEYSGWYKTLTPLKLHCHEFVGAIIVQDDGTIKECIRSDVPTICFMPAKKDFYGNYSCEGIEYCCARMYKVASNLDLYSIHLNGTDDYSISFDVIGRQQAYEEWDRLLQAESITDNLVKDYYFSN
jgi:hypothetical protein